MNEYIFSNKSSKGKQKMFCKKSKTKLSLKIFLTNIKKRRLIQLSINCRYINKILGTQIPTYKI